MLYQHITKCYNKGIKGNKIVIMIKNKQIIKDFIIYTLLFFALLGSILHFLYALNTIAKDSKNFSQKEARCNSLQGEFGGGKCYKDGKEI